MAKAKIKWGAKDAAGRNGWHGVQLADGLKPTTAELTTFVDLLMSYSDAGKVAEEITSSVNYNTAAPGNTVVTEKGTVVIEDADGRTYAIVIPSIQESARLKKDNAAPTLTTVVCDSILAAFQTLTGLTGCRVIRSAVDLPRGR